MPIIQQKFQIYLNLALTFFFAFKGVKVIPNIRYGIDSTFNSFSKAIPKNSLIAIGTYGSIKTKEEKNLWLNEIIKIIETLTPKGIIVYGGLSKELTNLIKLYGIQLNVYQPFLSRVYKKSNE